MEITLAIGNTCNLSRVIRGNSQWKPRLGETIKESYDLLIHSEHSYSFGHNIPNNFLWLTLNVRFIYAVGKITHVDITPPKQIIREGGFHSKHKVTTSDWLSESFFNAVANW